MVPSAWSLLGSLFAAACPVSMAANVKRWPLCTSWVGTGTWSCRAQSSAPRHIFHCRYVQLWPPLQAFIERFNQKCNVIFPTILTEAAVSCELCQILQKTYSALLVKTLLEIQLWAAQMTPEDFQDLVPTKQSKHLLLSLFSLHTEHWKQFVHTHKPAVSHIAYTMDTWELYPDRDFFSSFWKWNAERRLIDIYHLWIDVCVRVWACMCFCISASSFQRQCQSS